MFKRKKQKRKMVMINEIDSFIELLHTKHPDSDLNQIDVFKLLYTHLMMLNYKYKEIGDVLHERYTNIMNSTKKQMDNNGE